MPSQTSPSFWSPPSWVLMGLVLLIILWAHLCVPFVAGLLMFVCMRGLHEKFQKKLSSRLSITAAAFVCVVVAFGVLTGLGMGITALLDDDTGAAALMLKMNEALLLLRHHLPSWISTLLPTTADSALQMAQNWLLSNAAVLPGLGKKALTILFHIVIGAFVGLMAAVVVVKEPVNIMAPPKLPKVVAELLVHVNRFTRSFEHVVFAQFNIALINAILTGLFLMVAMPLLGYPMPFVKVLVLITFLMGLLPILGNIISNTAICLVALSVAPMAALLCLAFLITIHKLEYFLNAWIIGTRIHVRSYEILGAMMVFEAVFGLWGLVLAPVLYSYIKDELLQSDAQ